MTVLRSGASGPLVRDLQVLLNRTVPVEPMLKVDGIFGPKTNARVIMFQNQAGLDADGLVGPFTNKALVSAVLAAIAKGPQNNK